MRCLHRCDRLRILRQRRDQQVLARIVQRVAAIDRLDDVTDPVDDREDGIDQRGIRRPAAVAHRRQRIFGGMAQPGEARQIEEAAAALHRVDEAEDRIQSRAIARIRLPRDDLARQSVERLAGFSDEFLQQVVHGSPGDSRVGSWRMRG